MWAPPTRQMGLRTLFTKRLVHENRVMRNCERGQTSAEYIGMLAVVVAIVAGLLGTGAPQRVAGLIADRICTIIGGQSCGSAGGDGPVTASPPSTDERVQRLLDNAERRRTELKIDTPEAAGSHFQQLHEQILGAIEAGRIDEAERLDAQLEMYIRLARGPDLEGSERGMVLEDLWMSDEKWREAVDQGSYYFGPEGDNVRYFDIPAAPGDGLLVMDYFIPFETSGQPPVQLKGDNRDFHPGGPLAQDLPLNQSRILVVLDRETGRGAIYQSHTCNVFYGQCAPARPIALSMDEKTQYVPQLSDEIRGPYIAPTNRFELTGDGDSVQLRYDALNSMTWPIISVDGTVELTRGADGTYTITRDERDTYPAIGIYQYRPGQEILVIQERDSDNVSPGAVPDEWDPWVPDFP